MNFFVLQKGLIENELIFYICGMISISKYSLK